MIKKVSLSFNKGEVVTLIGPSGLGKPTLLQQYGPLLFEGFINTLITSVVALFFSLIIGTIMAMLQLTPNKMVSTLANIYVELFRNIPLFQCIS